MPTGGSSLFCRLCTPPKDRRPTLELCFIEHWHFLLAAPAVENSHNLGSGYPVCLTTNSATPIADRCAAYHPAPSGSVPENRYENQLVRWSEVSVVVLRHDTLGRTTIGIDRNFG